MRKPIIAGNWKMNFTLSEGIKLVEELKDMVKDANSEVVICTPFIHLPKVKEILFDTNIKLGAQNMHFEESGAFTGEVSPKMLEDLGVEYVVIGHSERREYFNETNETVNKKVRSAFSHNLIPIMCCGETLEQRENGETKSHIEKQIVEGIKGIPTDKIEKLVVAYEPIWAIGTGKTATNEEANETIAFIRGVISKLYDENLANKVRILYGGSVKPNTIDEQMAMEDIDGALVGGASLKANDFARIVNFK